jgi:hypothetical protein
MMCISSRLVRLSDQKAGPCIIYRFDSFVTAEDSEQLLAAGVVEKLPAEVVANLSEGVIIRTDRDGEVEIGKEAASHIWVIPEH